MSEFMPLLFQPDMVSLTLKFGANDMLFFGNDPGGAAANGVAALDVVAGNAVSVRTAVVGSVDDAIQWFQQAANGAAPEMAGIDTYLSWATGTSGWRPMDTFLRNTYHQVKQSVFASNSASGSMAIQGMATAIRLRQTWAKILLNETHPKVQYFAICKKQYSYNHAMNTWLAQQIGHNVAINVSNQHEWDALFSALACWRAFSGAWTTDLMKTASASNLILPAGNVTYMWPYQPRSASARGGIAGSLIRAEQGRR